MRRLMACAALTVVVVCLLTAETVLEKEEIHASAVAGNVLTPTEEAIDAAQVRLTAPGSEKVVTEARTDTAGRFKLKHVKAGRYAMTISSPGFNTHVWDVVIGPSEQAVDIKVRLTLGS
jgi:hypothetical protein